MHLPGLITITPETPDALERAANIIGESFMEEQWFATWLAALDELGTPESRRRALLRATIYDDLAKHAPYEGAYLLEDGTAATGAYRYAELSGTTHDELEAAPSPAFEALATPDEKRVLAAQAQRMAPVSLFDWAREMEHEADHLYFYAWAVDPAARGTGALRRLLEPFFALADAENLNCYLECYTERLQHMYEHFGFELIDALACDELPLVERRMVRRAQATSAGV